MKTITVTEQELAIIKTALHMQIQSIDREIRFAKTQEKNIEPLFEIREQYKNAFEALSYVK
ncbi:hypothetical protein [Anoxybacillus gonensis]|uniref:hypothetical protein n=1 Tax=Anoxybacillus gonensis TaxID=198467 RepID=UPI0002C008D6|nr:hypothetical protein [Anoxybacillus gonensis]EMI09233.1 hypothetical protein F510_2638 [Anoxybacillus gonensis]